MTVRSSNPEKSAIDPRGRGVLDTPHARGMTTCCRRATCLSTNAQGIRRKFAEKCRDHGAPPTTGTPHDRKIAAAEPDLDRRDGCAVAGAGGHAALADG